MMTLDTKPTNEQLRDPSFWDNLPPDGAEYDGFEYGPHYSVLRNGEPINFVSDDGKKIMNSFTYDIAIEQVQHLSKDNENITLKITGFYEWLVRRDEYLNA